jgi:EAL domain-containing protein (putative c-di-GMP-specific phosphodiesterase class I)
VALSSSALANHCRNSEAGNPIYQPLLHWYIPIMNAPALDADGLREAIEKDQLFLLYQPQVRADSLAVVSVEALVRCRRPERGLVLPVDFVQFAERNDLIEHLGAWVLRRACRDGAHWPGIGVAVNVSPRQFRSPDFIAFVEATARAEGMPFRRLEIEITESAYFDDPDRAEVELRTLRALGIKVALDDFGTGYASLSYLRRLPLDKIKIDKSFVDALDTVDGAAIVRAVISLARALGLEVTAEGVETIVQQEFLRAAGCTYLQGYLFSPAVSAAEIAAILAGTAPAAGCSRA